jgi:hypothetical protein
MNTLDPRLEVRIEVRPHGRAPSTYGARAYKFAVQAARLLKARNWREVGRGAKYAYQVCPETDAGEQPVVIDVRIPSRNEVLTVAQQLHDVGEKWIGHWGEWEAGYRPANKDEFSWTVQSVDPITATRVGSSVRHSSRFSIEPLFIVGSPGLWSATVRWRNGDATYEEEAQNIILEAPTRLDRSGITRAIPEQITTNELYEGALHRTTTNRYERDASAREKCIAHHGAHCSVCGFDFGRVFGKVAGGYIHVHHLVLVSSIAKEYKVDPINDLVPVCPNCHVVLHLSDPPYTVDEVRTFLHRKK